jgi:hypothetical protein
MNTILSCGGSISVAVWLVNILIDFFFPIFIFFHIIVNRAAIKKYNDDSQYVTTIYWDLLWKLFKLVTISLMVWSGISSTETYVTSF